MKEKINVWYTNLQKTIDTFINQKYDQVRNWYNKALWFLIKIKNHEKWIIEWEMIIYSAQQKRVEQMMKFNNWIKNLFSAVNQVLFEWVNSYQLFSRNKIKADTLNFWNTVKNLQKTAAHQAVSRLIKFVSDSFKFLFVSKEFKLNEKSINEWKRKKCKSIKDFNDLSADAHRNDFVTSD